MRGFEYVGRVEIQPGHHSRMMFLDREPTILQDGYIIGFAPLEDGPLRCGFVVVRGVEGTLVRMECSPREAVPAMCNGDHVFVARAIGEHIFTRPS